MLPLARQSFALRVPVLVEVPAAGGRLLLARALHTYAGAGEALLVISDLVRGSSALPAGVGVYLDAGAVDAEAGLHLEALLDDGAHWLLVGLEPHDVLPPPLAARLSGLALRVPPLAERSAEVSQLADQVLMELAMRCGRPAPSLAAAAVARLQAHTWPGDMTELETVLARAFLTAGGAQIEEQHLVLTPPERAASAAVPGPTTSDTQLEYLLAELAHELRNPMVTIKTFAGHLPQLLADAELRGRFTALADDAIARMDSLLDNVLTFARLGIPHRETIDVAALVRQVIAESRANAEERSVHLEERAFAQAECAADREQLAYALRNLVAGVVREVPPEEQLVVETSANGVVTLRFAAGGAAADRLRRLAAPGDDASLADPTLLPLSFRLARSVLERNGGGLTVVPEGSGGTSVVVRLPT